MAWTTPATVVAGQLMTAAFWNIHVRDNEAALRLGSIAMTSQATNDFAYCGSATQLARLSAASGKTPRFDGAAWVMVDTWPIGSLFFSAVSTNPNTLLGFGTWAAHGEGRVPVGFDDLQAEFNPVGHTGGFKTHTLTTAELAVHTHVQDAHTHTVTGTDSGGSGGPVRFSPSDRTANSLGTPTIANATATNQDAGGGTAHNNLQPYIVVYMWKRIL